MGREKIMLLTIPDYRFQKRKMIQKTTPLLNIKENIG